ncbi:hypothetical protein BASA81_004087 [Batrachochytrium salamandrivorans]|nr:hypothetical protein BASA81_004087 [Batrachochytrium salamandrivorans]
MLFKVSTMPQAYACLFLAILFEVVGTSTMKANAGFSSALYTVIMFLAYTTSFSLMTLALEVLDLGVTYAVWSGVGTTVVAMIGALYYKESMPPIKVVAILCVIVSVMFLQFISHRELVANAQADATPREQVPLI